MPLNRCCSLERARSPHLPASSCGRVRQRSPVSARQTVPLPKRARLVGSVHSGNSAAPSARLQVRFDRLSLLYSYLQPSSPPPPPSPTPPTAAAAVAAAVPLSPVSLSASEPHPSVCLCRCVDTSGTPVAVTDYDQCIESSLAEEGGGGGVVTSHSLRLLALTCCHQLMTASLRQRLCASTRSCRRLQQLAAQLPYRRLLQLLESECRLTSQLAAECLVSSCRLIPASATAAGGQDRWWMLRQLVECALQSPLPHTVVGALTVLRRLVELPASHADVEHQCHDDEADDDEDDEDGTGGGRHHLAHAPYLVCSSPTDAQTPAAAATGSHSVTDDCGEGSAQSTAASLVSVSQLRSQLATQLASCWLQLTQRFCHRLVLSGGAAGGGDNDGEVLAFLALWTALLAVGNSLSVAVTQPFYSRLDCLSGALVAPPVTPTAAAGCGSCRQLSPAIWRAVVAVFSEVLCYGSTLALQESVDDETAACAHALLRLVRTSRLLDAVPPADCGLCGEQQQQQLDDGATGGGGVGAGVGGGSEDDLLQSMVLLVLKALAVTVKETRSDSSSSSSSSCCSYTGEDEDGSRGRRRCSSRLSSSRSAVATDAVLASASDSHYSASSVSSASSFDDDWLVIGRSLTTVVTRLDCWLKQRAPQHHPQSPPCRWCVPLLASRDDTLIEALLCLADIGACFYQQQQQLHCGAGGAVCAQLAAALCPHTAFVSLLETVGYHHDLLLDFLLSNETCFLLYLLRQLKFMRRTFGSFVRVCGARLQPVMTVLIRLRLTLRRLVAQQLFPYNIGPLVKLLDSCEKLYEAQGQQLVDAAAGGETVGDLAMSPATTRLNMSGAHDEDSTSTPSLSAPHSLIR